MKTFFHPLQRLHHPRTYLSRGQMRQPQELPARIDPLLAVVERLGYPLLQPADHGLEPLAAVHSRAYLEYLSSAYQQWHEVPEDWGDEVMSNIYIREGNPLRGILGKTARYLADGSCPIGEHTWQAAYWSAQSAVAAAQAVLEGNPAAYALCRPPGHHARAEAAGGFCFLNNAAIAAQVLRGRFAKVAVLDTDMHHGQGIQEIFYERDDVLYVSIHGDPTNFYPVVAGFDDEIGSGSGVGFNLNLPMPHGASEADFFACLDQAETALRAFAPDVLVLSLGFDIYEKDPQSKVSVSHAGFQRLGQRIRALELPCVVVQEGGYDIATLEENARRFFEGLTG
ncbi:histone deacetylase family protein [Pseudomonas rhizoryzae]|uniref:histone deacetylase family protein n=1 Tax=Pseudomonas rhizoryzae TaxID=2571129 RepID=UPI0007367008|nr:histone deacetylase family protein [Pseudomonas rhizoryzae]KTT29409.1 acetylpolyamine aminohydrolase [Pseudomonas psychrotolerans]KTT34858.1 acetylpolyamine aminohydrolase [Pseudomonas psychrotolerans]KTT78154.1 acetylpolyamine aminohydrolase [Pseudomonas psychrotolerans]